MVIAIAASSAGTLGGRRAAAADVVNGSAEYFRKRLASVRFPLAEKCKIAGNGKNVAGKKSHTASGAVADDDAIVTVLPFSASAALPLWIVSVLMRRPPMVRVNPWVANVAASSVRRVTSVGSIGDACSATATTFPARVTTIVLVDAAPSSSAIAYAYVPSGRMVAATAARAFAAGSAVAAAKNAAATRSCGRLLRMFPAMLAPIVLSALMLAQGAPAQSGATAVPMAPLAAPIPQPLENGPCLDSTRPVPRVLQPPIDRSMQVVRIDKVESTATMMPGEVLGFLYTLGDGSTWLGQRSDRYMSGAAATSINQVLSTTHLPGQNVSEFPPRMIHGVATKYTEFFRVEIPPTTYSTLRIQVVPCVAWPAGRALPDPMM